MKVLPICKEINCIYTFSSNQVGELGIVTVTVAKNRLNCFAACAEVMGLRKTCCFFCDKAKGCAFFNNYEKYNEFRHMLKREKIKDYIVKHNMAELKNKFKKETQDVLSQANNQ